MPALVFFGPPFIRPAETGAGLRTQFNSLVTYRMGYMLWRNGIAAVVGMCLSGFVVSAASAASVDDITIGNISGTFDKSTGLLHLNASGSFFQLNHGSYVDGTFVFDGHLTPQTPDLYTLDVGSLDIDIPSFGLDVTATLPNSLSFVFRNQFMFFEFDEFQVNKENGQGEFDFFNNIAGVTPDKQNSNILNLSGGAADATFAVPLPRSAAEMAVILTGVAGIRFFASRRKLLNKAC